MCVLCFLKSIHFDMNGIMHWISWCNEKAKRKNKYCNKCELYGTINSWKPYKTVRYSVVAEFPSISISSLRLYRHRCRSCFKINSIKWNFILISSPWTVNFNLKYFTGKRWRCRQVSTNSIRMCSLCNWLVCNSPVTTKTTTLL